MDNEQKATNGKSEPLPAWKMKPEAALATSLLNGTNSQRIADQLPDIKKSAYILLVLTIFTVFQSFMMHQVVITMLGADSFGFGFIKFTKILGWSATIFGCLILLTTKSTKVAKTIIIVIGLWLIYFTISGLFHFDVIGTAINLFLLYWTYNLEQSVEALDIVVP